MKNIINFLRSFALLFVFLIFFNTIIFAIDDYKSIKLPSGEIVKISREEHKTGYRYDIVFSDGNTYFYEVYGNLSTGGGSPNLTGEQMIHAQEAIKLYEQKYGLPKSEKNESSRNLLGLLFIALGIIGILSPKISWYLSIGWKLKEAEPSKIALVINRILGVILFVVGIITLF
ncbi:DUF6199 family natural product biosynthesis protein [Caloranaerobacter ferrireducens]|uniref:DUF6199 family natural product biosynthesis protein n=1 Tax=Caloranaerobacter ferrireducens TaxID=1323370 RepID=UPI00084D4756|nr:DUF6199 family natural product biosynthesis protein [Caloranaerobacter ferrireducens]